MRDYLIKINIIFLLPLLLISFISCTTVNRSLYLKFKPDTLKPYRAFYPKYRLDNKINRIIIIGTGEGKSEIISFLTKAITEYTDIKVIEPGNLRSILGGKIIEYGTNFTPEESQLISQLFQTNYILKFDEKISPHSDYIFGGRTYNKINLKIMDALSGEIMLQISSEFGGTREDPRRYGYSHLSEMTTSNKASLRTVNLNNINFQLKYALGGASVGIIYARNRNQAQVSDVYIDSPAEKAGIQKGDIFLEIHGIKVNNWTEIMNTMKTLPKQGGIIKGKIKRAEEILDIEIILPLIPFSPQEEQEIDKPVKNLLLL